MVAWFQPWKLESGHGGGEIVSLGLAVAEKGFRHHAADAVLAAISGVRFTKTIPVPTGHWFTSAHQKWLTENVASGGADLITAGHPDVLNPGESAEGVAHFDDRWLTDP